MRRFFRALMSFTAAVHVVFAISVHHLIAIEPWATLAAIAVAIGLVAVLRWRIRHLMDDRPISAPRRLLERLYYAHWGASLLSSFLFLPALLLAILGIASVGAVATGAYGFSLVIALYSVFIRTRWVHIRTLEIPIEGLPKALDGYRITQLSDIHVGSLFPASVVRRFVRASNHLAPDLVALTGDYLTSGTHFHGDVAAVLGELRAKDGVFAVWGNHDNYGGREPLRTLLIDGGVKLLENESAKVSRDGASFTLVGVDDIFSRRADVERSFEHVDSGAVVIGLVHDPKQFPAVAAKGASLVLTGHTHWGQIGLPLVERRVNLARRFFRFSGGLYKEGSATLYVHPGVGETGPPIRFGVAPEVTLFVLRAA